jgi:hypothetical protein
MVKKILVAIPQLSRVGITRPGAIGRLKLNFANRWKSMKI